MPKNKEPKNHKYVYYTKYKKDNKTKLPVTELPEHPQFGHLFANS